jgi:hypothetical protein
MNFKIGTRVVFQGNHNSTLVPMIKEGLITKVGKDTVWLDNAHKSEDQVYAAFLYPDTPECRAFLQAQLDLRARIKQMEDEFMVYTYQFNNELVRKDLK